ncbi:MAG: exonuclease domain-containing protein [Planctomycetes bacterium]|nr:exonuclease domain-containing protein [Planctomycetota bacterium]
MPRRRPDLIVIVDIEATCWEDDPPPGQESEIIEIGVCFLDIQSGERMGRESLLVRPEHSEVSPFCTQVTSITPQRVAQGVPFEDAWSIAAIPSRLLPSARQGLTRARPAGRACRAGPARSRPRG